MESTGHCKEDAVLSTPWRILDFTSYHGRVTAGKGSLQAGGKEVPLADISVVIVGVDVDLHSSVFDRAAAFGFPILHCDWKGVPCSATWPWSTHTRVAARHISQSEMEIPRRKNAWMRIVRAKILGQAFNLRSDPESASYLLELSKRVRSGDPSNCEGQAARYYWRRFFEDSTFRRVTQSRNSLNGMLDYGYTILRGGVVRSLVSAGLWPTLGVWHRNRGNVFALADDFVEPFRPAVDALVEGLCHQGASLDVTAKRALSAVLDNSFTERGYTVGTEINRLAQNFSRYAEGLERVLEVPSYGSEIEVG